MIGQIDATRSRWPAGSGEDSGIRGPFAGRPAGAPPSRFDLPESG